MKAALTLSNRPLDAGREGDRLGPSGDLPTKSFTIFVVGIFLNTELKRAVQLSDMVAVVDRNTAMGMVRCGL